MSALYSIIEKLIIMMYGIFGDYGLAIIAITILIKVVLLPLTLKQDKSMRAMKKIQPEIEKIKEKYKNDPQTLNQKTMELYKEYKVNPAGGCLPLLLQMPILFALFGALRKATEVGGFLQNDPHFLWFTLGNPDPLYILPVLNGLIAFVQQKIMGTADSNPQMKSMMYMFPVMMVFISYKMPGGLQLYWFTSSAAGLLQQYYIMKRGDEA